MKNSLIFALVTVAATSLQAASFEDHARVLDVQERYSGNSSNSVTRTVCEPVQQGVSHRVEGFIGCALASLDYRLLPAASEQCAALGVDVRHRHRRCTRYALHRIG